MSDRRHTRRPTLPVGYRYCETRDRAYVYSELMREAHRLIAEDMAIFERDMSLRVDADRYLTPMMQRIRDETL